MLHTAHCIRGLYYYQVVAYTGAVDVALSVLPLCVCINNNNNNNVSLSPFPRRAQSPTRARLNPGGIAKSPSIDFTGQLLRPRK